MLWKDPSDNEIEGKLEVGWDSEQSAEEPTEEIRAVTTR